MNKDPIKALLENRFAIAAFMSIVEKVHGESAMEEAKSFIREVQQDGQEAINKYRACPPEQDEPAVTTIAGASSLVLDEFSAAFLRYDLSNDDENDLDGLLPCPIVCAAKSTKCKEGCDLLPDWKLRLYCKLGCTLEFMACLARC